MTYIEFFEKDAAENMCTCLIEAPERVVLLGDRIKVMQQHAERYGRLLSERGEQTEFVCRSVNKNSLSDIINALSLIIETYGECVFDLTGGEDLYLVAMGIVFERYKEKGIRMHRINIRNNTMADCFADGSTVMSEKPIRLSVGENIMLYGGCIVYCGGEKDGTVTWDMNDDFRRDIDTMWNICKQNVRQWNKQIRVFKIAEELRDETLDSLTTHAPIPYVSDRLEYESGSFYTSFSIINDLLLFGLLTSFDCEGGMISLTYKNEQVKRCLTKAGQILEMKMYSLALGASEKDGSRTYNDVMTGVRIDWDGKIHGEGEGYDTENEIDVVMMHGLVPVFVSCKNGYTEIEELYKLDTVANRFGGKYAKKVLVATALDDSDNSEYLRSRAADMNIRLVEGIQEMSDSELTKLVRTFWSK